MRLEDFYVNEREFYKREIEKAKKTKKEKTNFNNSNCDCNDRFIPYRSIFYFKGQ